MRTCRPRTLEHTQKSLAAGTSAFSTKQRISREFLESKYASSRAHASHPKPAILKPRQTAHTHDQHVRSLPRSFYLIWPPEAAVSPAASIFTGLTQAVGVCCTV